MTIWLIIIGMAIVTYGPRVLPLTILNEESLPHWLRRGLVYVPIAVLSAISVPSFLPHEEWGQFTLDGHLIAGVVGIAAAWYSKNTIVTIVAGMVVLLLFT
jgi:branched-subunit amino acid transport protein